MIEKRIYKTFCWHAIEKIKYLEEKGPSDRNMYFTTGKYLTITLSNLSDTIFSDLELISLNDSIGFSVRLLNQEWKYCDKRI
jgi:hypothetical protein